MQTRVAAGENFAAWSLQKVGANVPLGGGAYSAARVPARHYWLQIDRGGKPYALDPTLASTKDGEHLGTADGSFQPSALLPSEDYHVARVRFMQTASDGSSKPVASVEDRIANLAYAPIRVSLASDAAPATSVTAALVVGSKTIGSGTIAASGSDAPAQLVLEVQRRDPAGVSTTDRRVVYDKTRDGTDLRARALGLHTMVLAPGSAPALFLHETYRNMISLSDNVAAARNHTTPTFGGTYPQLIADYLTRDDIVAATLSQKNKIRLYRDRANLIELHQRREFHVVERALHVAPSIRIQPLRKRPAARGSIRSPSTSRTTVKTPSGTAQPSRTPTLRGAGRTRGSKRTCSTEAAR